MKGWRMLNWICLPVGELNPSTVALRSQGNRRGCWLVNFAHVARGVGVEFPSGHSRFSKLSKSLEGY